MWSTFTDRDRAKQALQSKKLSPAQAKAKAQRERSFNAGFDAAVRATTPKEILRRVVVEHGGTLR